MNLSKLYRNAGILLLGTVLTVTTFAKSTLVIAYAQNPKDHKHYALVGDRRDNKGWAFLGGTVDPGESFANAAARELYEESATMYGYNHKSHSKGKKPIFPRTLNRVRYSDFKNCRTYFVKVPYVSYQQLNANLAKATKWTHREMRRLTWVPIAELKRAMLNHKNKPSLTLQWDNKRLKQHYKITLWDWMWHNLKQPRAQRALRLLPN